jgi:predicted ATPase
MVSDDENEPSYTSTTLVKLPPNEQGVESPSNEQLEENKEQGDKAKKLSKCTRLYGRTSERRQLLQAYQSSHTSELRSAVVLIKGPAGIGKTALVTSLKEELQRDKGHMLTWKCDRHTLLQIASGFAAAIQNLADDVLARSDDELDAMKQRLRQKLDATQVAMMIKAYPPLEPLLDTQDYPTQRDQEYGYDWSAFKCFIGSLCSLKSPMVYFVDDFQWVEPNALTIMMERAHNVQLQGALFVLTYNSDLEDTDSNWYQEIQTLKQKNYVDVTEIILVKNLDERATSSMVSDILRVPKDHNVLINEWIYRQTKGNPLYIEELMHGLYEKGVLAVDNDANSWTFNQEQAGLHCGGCNNVSEYLSMKLKALPRSLQEVLKVASCLGYRFTPKLVSSAMSGSVTTYLDSAKQAGLVTDHRDGMRSRSWQTGMEPKDNKEWHFIHNSMQEAAVLLVGGHSEQASFHLAIGRKLFKVLNEEELKDDLLTVLGHVIIGSGAIKSKEEKYRFAQLALMAARKCVKLTSFKSAHKSLSFAIGLLSERSWREDYDLTLAIYNAAAEVAYAKGDFELAEQMVAEVMKGGRTFDDKLQANTTKLYALGSMNRSSEAIALGLELLKELGESFPTKPNKWHFQYSILTTRWLLKGKSDETLLRSPSMSDCRTVSAMQILNIMFTAALFDKPMLAPLLAMRMVQLSLKHGFCAASCLAFSTYGMLLVSNGVNVDQGTRMGDLGMKLLDRFQAKEWIPRVYAAVYGFIHGWTRPNQLAFEPLLRGYRVALETGDIEVSLLMVPLTCFAVIISHGFPSLQ